MKTVSLSRKLLSRVLSFYFVLTFIVTVVQISAEYSNTKKHIISELLTLENTFSGSLTRAVWELNSQQVIDITDGLGAIPMIQSVIVKDENNEIIAHYGEVIDDSNFVHKSLVDTDANEYDSVSDSEHGLFGHSFPLIFEFSGRTNVVGSVTLLSNEQVIFNRIRIGIFFLIGNAVVKTCALVLLFSIAFSRLLTTPLNQLTEQIDKFDIDDPEASKLHNFSIEKNELNILQNAYNNLIDELILYKEQFEQAQREVNSTNLQLDEQNLMLEQEVAKKTSSLSNSMLKMEIQQRELLEQQDKLKKENERRSKTEKTLIKTNHELKNSIFELNKAQKRLLEVEKMASLGSISAEISHEVNTPIGISITSTSYLTDSLNSLKQNIKDNNLSKRVLNDFTDNLEKGIKLITTNILKASELIQSFKQVAVDQLSDNIRKVNIYNYLNEIIKSLQPKLKKTKHQIILNCDPNIEIYCHAGAISQIFTNLIINSILHGFENIEQGEITISIKLHEDCVHIIYQDNGLGLSADGLNKLFDAFYTTASNKGGTGLGTHIIQELVQDTLNGTIKATSEPGNGLKYDIKFNNMK